MDQPNDREHQPRERMVPCRHCRRDTMDFFAICTRCAATLAARS